MAKKMLIDATHPEETRVVVMDDNRLEDFDFESKVKQSYKGNIFLAKVTRVEPSLQAAFVNYGGNRHGFLPFSEIHPDYYRIPVEDRERLMKEQEELALKLQEREEAQENGEGSGRDFDEDLDAIIEEIHGEMKDDAEKDAEKAKKSPARGKKSAKSDEAEEAVTEEKVDAKAKDKKDDAEAKAESEEAEANADSDDTDSKGKPRRKVASKRRSKKKDDEVSEELEDKAEDSKESSDDLDDDNAEDDDQHDEGSSDSDSETDSDTDADSEDGEKNDKNDRNDRNNRSRGRFRGRRGRRGRPNNNNNRKGGDSSNSGEGVESVGGGDDFENDPVSLMWKKMRRSYKIQEVIKRGQIMLVQCQKEERGSKGAAMTSYITLPGRYGVLMPNSPRGGGISRKVGWGDRKTLKEVLKEVTIPKGMSVILRTAAVDRTKPEIKRDLEYLYRLWDSIRELTLKSSAPALVYEEGQLIKRAIRDIYSRDVDEVFVAGEQGFQDTREFMKMMIPSHARRVKEYKEEDIPLFTRYQAEHQIDEIYDPEVSLKSGGYLVIHPTEALVSIDVNSGKSTRERNIEGTALKTNMEAAEEVARQLRLRDLGGLVVIDFIDMENYRNNREVERKLTEALSSDRARVQVGRISNFGLLELSRQRLRPSLTETHFETCRHCKGSGTVRTKETAALKVMRQIEEEGLKGRTDGLRVTVPVDVGLYILNGKRDVLVDMEKRYGLTVDIILSDEMVISDSEFERYAAKSKRRPEDDDHSHDHTHKSDGADIADILEETDIDDYSDEDESDDSETKAADAKVSNSGDKGDAAESAPRERSSRSRSRRRSNQKRNESSEKAADDTKSDTAEKKPAEVKEKAEEPKDEPKKEAEKAPAANENAVEKEAPVEEKQAPKKTAKTAANAKADKKEYEVINQPPEKKKKGWWSNILE